MKQPVRIMGIVNLTGDSFYPPSRMLGADGRLDRALFLGRCRQMASEGASFLDLGACSTRPGSEPVSEAEEWDRLSPALEALSQRVRRSLAEGGIPYDRKRFSPHVTLLRRAKGVLPGIGPMSASMTAEAFSLFRSDRGKKGMIYTELASFPAEGP